MSLEEKLKKWEALAEKLERVQGDFYKNKSEVQIALSECIAMVRSLSEENAIHKHVLHKLGYLTATIKVNMEEQP